MDLVEEKESEEYAEEDEEENDKEKEISEVNFTALHTNSHFFQTSCSSSPTQSRWVGVSGTGEAAAEAEEERAKVVVEREHMFDKVVTPSDVGKLNRLVIPKQYAERYFPIDPASDEKGLQLSFEDESGKVWRFRYSYWNSSQSYVLTKGWSRYVKDKRLHASDVVSFHRGDRLYIRYRRSSEDGSPAAVGWGQLVHPASGPPIFYPRAGDGTATMMGGSPEAGSKRVVRLFGVNLDCPAVDATQPAWGRGV